MTHKDMKIAEITKYIIYKQISKAYLGNACFNILNYAKLISNNIWTT